MATFTILLGPGSALGKEEKKIGERRGEKVAPTFPPSQATARLASFANIFSF